jgi:hypothetical protein
LILVQHQYNNCTATPHMRVGPSMWDPPSCEGLLYSCCIDVVNLTFSVVSLLCTKSAMITHHLKDIRYDTFIILVQLLYNIFSNEQLNMFSYRSISFSGPRPPMLTLEDQLFRKSPILPIWGKQLRNSSKIDRHVPIDEIYTVVMWVIHI